MLHITPIEERDYIYEQAVLDAARQQAETHVWDVLATLEAGLAQLRYRHAPGHDGKVGSQEAIEQGNALLGAVVAMLPGTCEPDYCSVVAQCDEEDRLLSRDEYVADGVREHVAGLLKGLVK